MSEINQQTEIKPNSFAKWIGRGIGAILIICALIIGLITFSQTSSTTSSNTSQDLY